MRRLLVVTERFLIRSRGVIVAPFLDVSEARRDRFPVELRRPDGTSQRIEAFSQVPFISPTPAVHHAHVTLLGIAKDDVPEGTEVWTLDDAI